MTQDIRLAFRRLLAHRVVTGLGAISLALAIGGNATAFSLLSAIFLRPLPYPEPDRLVTIWQTDEENAGFDLLPASPANYVDWKERAQSFTSMAALEEKAFSLRGGDRPEPVDGVAVTTNLFGLLGARAALGRTFSPEDGLQGKDHVLVLSQEFWRKRFGADAGVVGTDVELGGERYRVIGVLEETFELLDPRYELWVPLVFPRGELARDRHTLGVFARLNPGVGLREARQEMKVIAAALESEYPDDNVGTSAAVLTLPEQVAYGGGQQVLTLLQGALFFVLLIAAANLSHLLLAQRQERQRELALRGALGATRARLIRQSLVESLVLALGGGLMGLLVAAWGIDFMAAIFAAELPRSFLPRMDSSVVGFTFAVSLAAGIGFGLLPALRSSRPDGSGALGDESRGASAGPRQRFLAQALVVAEVAMALVLLTGVGIFVRSVRHWRELDAGVRTENLLTVDVALPATGYGEGREIAALHRRIVDEIEAVAGVEKAAFANHLPRSPFAPRSRFVVGERATEGEKEPSATALVVSSEYFRAMSIPVLRGRAFARSDRWDAAPVVVINEAMDRLLFPDGGGLGRRIVIRGASHEIVGVVGNVREDLFRDIQAESEPILYLPEAQNPSRRALLVVQTDRFPEGFGRPIRDTLWKLEPRLTVSAVQTMEAYTAQFFVGVGAVNALLSAFAALAVFLAAIGIYGVIAFSTSRRTQELGVRMALGARRGDVVWLVLREGLVLAAIGFGIGVPGAFAITRIVSSLLAGLIHVPLETTLATAGGLFLVAVLASYVPARRAARLDPTAALRHD